MIVTQLTTSKYGKLFNSLVGEINTPDGDIVGKIKITRLRKFTDDRANNYYDGEVDIHFTGNIMSRGGQLYSPSQYKPIKIRSYMRTKLNNHINMYTRPFGINRVNIKKITF